MKRARQIRTSILSLCVSLFYSFIAMNRLHGERRKTHGDVLGASSFRRAIANPLSRMRNDRLSGPNFQNAVLVFHSQRSLKHDGNFFEFRRLARLDPALW